MEQFLQLRDPPRVGGGGTPLPAADGASPASLKIGVRVAHRSVCSSLHVNRQDPGRSFSKGRVDLLPRGGLQEEG